MEQEQARSLTGGVNQTGVRVFNERLILSLLQRNGAMPGSALARGTGLSPQTVSVILRKLETDGLLQRGETQRGRVGKPSVPMGLNPDGLFSYGLKIGRRSVEVLLMDVCGAVRQQLRLRYPYPTPAVVFDFLRDSMRQIEAALPPELHPRICGIGVAAPFQLWTWHAQINAPAEALADWQTVDFTSEIARFSALPVHVVNDATAACRAEHMYGRGKAYRDYAYFFVGAFIGGGVVLNHRVLEGNQGNAGALGSLSMLGPDGQEAKLLDLASIHLLEQRLRDAGKDPGQLWQLPMHWSGFDAEVTPWLDQAADAIARASLATCAVMDFEAVLIDGALPDTIRAALVDRTRTALAALDARGLILPRIECGAIGPNARAIGAASGPIISQYLLDTNSVFNAAL
ncbi:putative transcriptional regulator, marR family [Phaeobacter piscinae]|uniref:Transcriptional regulator, marR family n=1 Tax=Phaeobacter piscinae TaxID=1580596 RepID=A0ABN5DH80_9RHOB|nr:ROK family transcriptional regulator [Phaeobacter piscinae]ATG36705.1 putative transcriptional regulator, marR family [Phaeobacter piscinae]AUQ87226.1 putative transcriptional regulator, marR family [Phaeobacter piscinae]AUR25109.1 putative transcriptional regulator, marR family [Phaeobacter piscinae]